MKLSIFLLSLAVLLSATSTDCYLLSEIIGSIYDSISERIGVDIFGRQEVEATTPTIALTTAPTTAPTCAPTTDPTTAPTTDPTTAPTIAPTTAPTTSTISSFTGSTDEPE